MACIDAGHSFGSAISCSVPETVPGGLNISLKHGDKVLKQLRKYGWNLTDTRIQKLGDGRMSVPLNRLGERQILNYLDIIKNNPALSNTISDFLFHDLRDGIITYESDSDYRTEKDKYIHRSGSSDSDSVTFIELFAGIGGFRLGLEPIGGQCVFSCDIYSSARKVYESHFLDRPEKNIVQLDGSMIPPYDILTGGFPCQSFSNSGKKEGFDDLKTGGCFFELLRIIRSTRPKCIFLENVMGLVFGANGAWFKTVIKELEKSGYCVYWKIYDSLAHVPQKRERVYFVGFRNDLKHEFTWPSPDTSDGLPSLRDIIQPLEEFEALLETPRDDQTDLMLTKRQWEVLQKTPSFLESRSRIVNFEYPARCIVASYRNNWKHQSQLVFQTEERPRFFTPREVARIMGFPDSFPVSHPGIYSLLGNAVIPPVITMIGKAIFETLHNATQSEPNVNGELDGPRASSEESINDFMAEYIRKSRLWSKKNKKLDEYCGRESEEYRRM